MAKAPAKDPFRCVECGWSATKWVGRCGECQAWGSVEEIAAPKKLSLVAGSFTTPAKPIGDVDLASAKARSSGVGELDRVLGGGLVPGAAILLAGEPGVGKSTLLLTVAAETAKQGILSLYISGEESASQVRLRAERLNAIDKNLWLAAESDLGAVIAHIDSVKPELLVIDSKQPTSSDAPNLFLIALINRSLEWRSPSKFKTTSTKCSSKRGPAIEPSLVTWPTRTKVIERSLAILINAAAISRT